MHSRQVHNLRDQPRVAGLLEVEPEDESIRFVRNRRGTAAWERRARGRRYRRVDGGLLGPTIRFACPIDSPSAASEPASAVESLDHGIDVLAAGPAVGRRKANGFVGVAPAQRRIECLHPCSYDLNGFKRLARRSWWVRSANWSPARSDCRSVAPAPARRPRRTPTRERRSTARRWPLPYAHVVTTSRPPESSSCRPDPWRRTDGTAPCRASSSVSAEAVAGNLGGRALQAPLPGVRRLRLVVVADLVTTRPRRARLRRHGQVRVWNEWIGALLLAASGEHAAEQQCGESDAPTGRAGTCSSDLPRDVPPRPTPARRRYSAAVPLRHPLIRRCG